MDERRKSKAAEEARIRSDLSRIQLFLGPTFPGAQPFQPEVRTAGDNGWRAVKQRVRLPELVRGARPENAGKIDRGEARAKLPQLVRSAHPENAGKIDSGEAHEVNRVTIKRDGEEKFAASSSCKQTIKRDGEGPYRQTPAGQKNAIESARVLAARGAGETLDDLTEEQREAVGARVAAEVSQCTDEALSKDDNAVAYIAVGGWERMVVNLQAAEANSWNNLSKCELVASLLRTNPAVLVLVDGNAQRFTSAHIRKVCAEPSLRPALHLPSCSHRLPPSSQPS